MRNILFPLSIVISFSANSQSISGSVTSGGEPVPFANVFLENTTIGTATDEKGLFKIDNLGPGSYTFKVTAIGYRSYTRSIIIDNRPLTLRIKLLSGEMEMNEVVITGTMKEVNRLETPVPVEVYSPTFFKKNPTPSLFEAMQNVNGVRPQMNCNICNTGDIHINGLEGPYTMVLIDGMPIVSGLSSVYGLLGIPNSIIQQVEVVKGPASSLYGSEAVGGLINVVTKNPENAPKASVDYMATTWKEHNLDIGYTFNLGKRADVLTGINYFNYSNPIDNNGDNFTDLPLQDRISIFQKWNIRRKSGKSLSLAGRYLYEDRWGGEMNWNTEYRGGDEIYGESIYTKRWELIGNYELPIEEKINMAVSYNSHNQNSYYGDIPYFADQNIGFTQLTWDRILSNHDLLIGTALRYTYYDDNSPATANGRNPDINAPDKTWLPGIFAQNSISIGETQKLLLGIRYDHHSDHGNIWTPRIAYKWATKNNKHIIRLNAGSGFRVVNLFTEEHAALTGAREVAITENLNPEQSYNVNLNYISKFYPEVGIISGEFTLWHTYFTNQILPDYDTNPNQIIYDNLDGHAVTQGISLNLDIEFISGLNIMAGVSLMDVYTKENDTKRRPILTEKWTGTWGISYKIYNMNLNIDYTGNLYGPMRLPLLGPLDPRPEMSPWFSIQNIKLSWKKPTKDWEIYSGAKNLLNFTPADKSIARAHDPFDKKVEFNENGKPVVTSENPYALTFDPSYVYISNQGIRFFLGLRYQLD